MVEIIQNKMILHNKKTQKAKTSSHFITIPKMYIESMDLQPGDRVKVTIERETKKVGILSAAVKKSMRENNVMMTIDDEFVIIKETKLEQDDEKPITAT